MKYVDGYVLVIKSKDLKKYKKEATKAGDLWIKCGALEYIECVGEDMKPSIHGVTQLGFPKLTKLKPGEKVIFAYVVYRSKKHRDQVNKKVMEECKKIENKEADNDIFKMNRFSYAGFETIVEKKRK